jgi:2-desacetyl-2-hydroxyethyl bacteriochlorophyllide A dehydrogenase
MKMMKAIELVVKEKTFRTIEIPTPSKSDLSPNQVLVKVTHSALDTTIDSMVKQDIVAGFLHDMKSKPILVGYHFSGQVVSAGSDVSTDELAIGTSVFGHLQYEHTTKQGTVSEYIVVDANGLSVFRPKDVLTPVVAAASATESMTALQGLRDVGGLQKGQKVLIVGAGGGVGSAAVGIAKSLGAGTVSAVCSRKDVTRVESMGADVVIDRKQTNLKNALNGSEFDIIFDSTGKYGMWKVRPWLKKGGSLVSTLPSIEKMLFGWFFTLWTGRKLGMVMCRSKKADLELVAKWIESGTLRIDVDSVFEASDFDKAWTRHQDPTKKGRIIIQIEDGW